MCNPGEEQQNSWTFDGGMRVNKGGLPTHNHLPGVRRAYGRRGRRRQRGDEPLVPTGRDQEHRDTMDELSDLDGFDEFDESEEGDSELMLVSRSIHEAGHAVVALKLGLSVRFATILPLGSYVGCVEVRPPSDAGVLAATPQRANKQLPLFGDGPLAREQLLRVATLKIMFDLAGFEAEKLFTSGPYVHHNSDSANAEACARRATDSSNEAEALIRHVRRRVSELIVSSDEHVLQLARRLRERRQLFEPTLEDLSFDGRVGE
jgi:hypothetical protein